MRTPTVPILVAGIVPMLIASSGLARPATLTDISFGCGSFGCAFPIGLSRDGRRVAYTESLDFFVGGGRSRPIIWDRGVGLTSLGTDLDITANPNLRGGFAHLMLPAGTIIFGTDYDTNRTYRWTAATGRATDLWAFDPFPAAGTPLGEVLVGKSSSAQPLRQVAPGAATTLSVPAPNTRGAAVGISDSGAVTIGSVERTLDLGIVTIDDGYGGTIDFQVTKDISEAVRWDAAGAVTVLPKLPGTDSSIATLVSANGSSIFGLCYTAADTLQPVPTQTPVIWTASGVAQLPSFVNASSGQAIIPLPTHVTADGRVRIAGGEIVGSNPNFPQYLGPIVWTPSQGWRSLRTVLASQGLTALNTAYEVTVYGMSADASTLLISYSSTIFSSREIGVISGAQLADVQTCVADFNSNGTANIDDIFIFLNAWFQSDPRCDVSGTGGVNIDDIFIFLNLWFAGC